jgi:tRNA(adenine34) deaminase
MALALQLAEQAARRGEVPVGAVLVSSAGRLLGWAHNLRESLQDPTAHAEILALRQAAATSGSWRLPGSTLYVTLEPCPMCAGALVNARVGRLVYGCPDPKAGAAGTLYELPTDPRLNHRLTVQAGVGADEARRLLQDFFARRRPASRAGAAPPAAGEARATDAGASPIPVDTPKSLG